MSLLPRLPFSELLLETGPDMKYLLMAVSKKLVTALRYLSTFMAHKKKLLMDFLALL